MTKQTLVQAVYLATSGKSRSLASAIGSMCDKPQGGWPETQQAFRQMIDELPARSLRSYTADQFLEATCYTDHADRWQARDPKNAIDEAAKIEAKAAPVATEKKCYVLRDSQTSSPIAAVYARSATLALKRYAGASWQVESVRSSMLREIEVSLGSELDFAADAVLR